MFLQAKKSLGQHFLNSKHVLGQIIEASHIQKGELVLEIGPGTGVLTEALLQTGAKVISIEKDERAIEDLKEKFKANIAAGQLTLIYGDILDKNTDFTPKEGYSIIANIPYYITGAILEKFLENERQPDKMVLLVQKEVAERIVASDKKESVLSISVKAFGKPEIIAKVPPGAFTPPPNVDSAILSIGNISNSFFKENNIEIKDFFRLVKAGFAHKRKFAIRNMEDAIDDKDKLEIIWNSLQLDKKIRSEDIAKNDWLNILKMYK